MSEPRPPYQQRVIDELEDLTGKLDRLEAYAAILAARIALFEEAPE